MDKILEKALDIRYVKLRISIVFTKQAKLPKYKVSTLRGGIGEMLLRTNCVRDRNCESCGFRSECIVQRIFYGKFDKKPDFVTTGESIGYVLECENSQEKFEKGETMEFQMLLFGKLIVYFGQLMQALYQMGLYGIGKEKATFQIHSVYNTAGEVLMDQNNVYMEQYQIQTVGDYVHSRLSQFRTEGKGIYSMQFDTPLTLKFQGEFLREFHMEALLRAVKRRVFMLDCFENLEGEDYYRSKCQIPQMIEQKAYPRSVKRVSFRKNRKLILMGIEGTLVFSNVEVETLELLLAGELIHIGKNTSFGFGKYKLNQIYSS